VAVTLPVVNGSSGTWGGILNAALTDIDNRLTAATAANTAQDTGISDLTTRIGTAETKITNLEASGGSSYPSKADLPTSATNGARAVTADTGIAWTWYSGAWYPAPGTWCCTLIQAEATNPIPTATATVIQLDTPKTVGVTGSYSINGNLAGWQPTVPGWYTLSGGISYTDTQAGQGFRQAYLTMGGTPINGSGGVVSPNDDATTTTVVNTRTITVYVPAGQKIQLVGIHTQGITLNTSIASSSRSSLSVVFAGWYPAS
jgi:hypothetical protein